MDSSSISADKILELEFNYIKDTANQAVDDRYKLLNFYIAVATFVATIAIGAFTVADIGQFVNLPTALAALCILISLIGWLFMCMIIRLRQAWHESVHALNQIKAYYRTHLPELENAFIWDASTIPHRHRFWNIHFYSALLIMIIDNAFLAAGLLVLQADVVLVGIVTLVAFLLQIIIYRVSLYRNL